MEHKQDLESIVGADPATADVVVYGAPYQGTASGRSGTVYGPMAVRKVLDTQIELYSRFSHVEPTGEHSFGFAMLDQLTGKTPEEMVNELEAVLAGDTRPYVLVGGEHSVTIPSVRALSDKIDPRKVTILQIDAHLDCRDDDSDYSAEPSRFAHSAVMRRAHELGFNIVSVGVRTMSAKEATYVAAHDNIQVFEWGRQHMLPPDHVPLPSAADVLAAIKTEHVYITLDVDGIDLSEMPGTGTPVPGGMSYAYCNALVRAVMQHKHVLAADVVEIATTDSDDPDDYSVTEYNGAQLVYEMLELLAQRP